MLRILANRTFRHLFLAQIVALLGTGLATVALALLAYDIAGERAGTVLGTALAIKMIAYVGVAPIASAFVAILPRRRTLVLLDLWRAGMVAFLPFVTEIWQVYCLIFLLQSGSAAFTPAFQATIPDVLPEEEDYTNALSLSRLAYDLESLISPMLAALLLGFMASNALFVWTAVGFLLSAVLVVTVRLPETRTKERRSIYDRTTRGIRIYLATPRLRGLLAINMAVAAVGAIIIVNTVVYVQGVFGLGERQTAFALACFGGGSMLAAFTLPQILKKVMDRSVMICAAGLLAATAFLISFLSAYSALLILWFLAGVAYASALVPSGRLLKRSAHPEDRPAVFAAQFALSHACWLATYPLAGWFGNLAGLPTTATLLGIIALCSAVVAWFLWPRSESTEVEHQHADLPPDHPHLREGHDRHDSMHSHDFVIDDLHPHWPGRQG
ncbi:MAG: MFS transporter [Rhizobiaceae bacterium]